MSLAEKYLPFEQRFGGNIPYQRDGRTYVMMNGRETWIRTCSDMNYADHVSAWDAKKIDVKEREKATKAASHGRRELITPRSIASSRQLSQVS